MADDKNKKLNDLRSQLVRLGYGRDSDGRRGRSGTADEIRRAVRKKRPAPLTPAREEKAILYARDLPRQSSVPSAIRTRRHGEQIILEEAVHGEEVVSASGGVSFVSTTRVRDVSQAEGLSGRFAEHLAAEGSAMRARISRTCNAAGLSHHDVIFMDVESTGLGNSPLFLIGIMLWNGDGLEVRQFFARNYAEERAVLAMFLEECAKKKLLVTFNGKSFDFPYIRARSAANGLRFDLENEHLDMLHECRRIWRERLPNCKLQTLETFICKRARHGDIPGSEIPDAYHAYVRSRDAWQMVHVLKHNMLDLVTMADLMNRFPPVPESE